VTEVIVASRCVAESLASEAEDNALNKHAAEVELRAEERSRGEKGFTRPQGKVGGLFFGCGVRGNSGNRKLK
jgi:hypothetical protein